MEAQRGLTADDRAMLEEAGPGWSQLDKLRRLVHAGKLSDERNRLRGRIEPPRAGDILEVPAPGPERDRLRARGLEALGRGEVGVLLLNGGMATRFGGAVKGAVPVDGARSFLGLKLLDAQRAAERGGAAMVPVILMNSRATHEATTRHLEAHDYFGVPPQEVRSFRQHWMVRLTPEGDVFVDGRGRPSFYAPGHGDVPSCINRGGELDRFVERGGRCLLMSNVDNVLASLDPVLIGLHLEHRGEITVEVVDKLDGDVGGGPARVDGHLQIVEHFRFPREFDQSTIPVFNTNTFWFDVEVFRKKIDLTWCLVEKRVGDSRVIQFERLIGEMTARVNSAFVCVSREGSGSRFIPVKTPDDLENNRQLIVSAWQARG